MKCERLHDPKTGELIAIVCSSGGRGYRERAHRCACRQVARLQCDWKLAVGKTCDAWICAGCAQEVGPNKHLCPAHQVSYIEWKARHAGEATSNEQRETRNESRE